MYPRSFGVFWPFSCLDPPALVSSTLFQWLHLTQGTDLTVRLILGLDTRKWHFKHCIKFSMWIETNAAGVLLDYAASPCKTHSYLAILLKFCSLWALGNACSPRSFSS